MGQIWSGNLQSTTLYQEHQARFRKDSQPPASGGGHTVCKIPEDEEVNEQTTERQYADWKKASGDSGILKEKSQLHNLKGPDMESASGSGSAPLPTRTRVNNVDYRHLADFSMFPDKFSISAPKPAQPGDKKDVTASASMNNISSVLLGRRTRAMSTSEATNSASKNEPTKPASDSKELSTPDVRRRSASFGGRLPFFDFSMIPDKDPHYKEIPRSNSMSKSQQEPEKSSKKDATTPTIVVTQDPASVVAAYLTMAANDSGNGKQTKEPVAKPIRRKSSYMFFDYTICPDKGSPGEHEK